MMARLETKVLAVDCVRKIIEMVDESETSHFDLTEANQFKEDHNGVSDRLVHMLYGLIGLAVGTATSELSTLPEHGLQLLLLLFLPFLFLFLFLFLLLSFV